MCAGAGAMRQGILTLADADIAKLVDEDHATLSTLLGSKDWFFGDQPSATDATVFAFLEASVNLQTIAHAQFPIHRDSPSDLFSLVEMCQMCKVHEICASSKPL